MDIVDFNLADDLPPRVVDKLNANFRRLARIIYREEPSQHDILQIDLPIPVGSGGTGTVSFHEDAVIIGNGTDPLTEVIPGTGYLYSSGGTPYWRNAEMGDSNWFGNGTPTGSRDPSSSWTTEQAKSDHAGDLYWSTASSGAVWYWAKTGTPATWGWNQLNISGGTGDKTYTHTQSTPSDTWVITHNMGKYPSIAVEDSAHNDVIGDYTYNSVNQVTLVFNGAFSGWAYLN